METLFEVESACLAVRAGRELLRQPSDVQINIGRSWPLFSSHVINVLDVGLARKSPSAGVKKTRKALRRLGLIGPKRPEKPTEGPGSGIDSVEVKLVEAVVL